MPFIINLIIIIIILTTTITMAIIFTNTTNQWNNKCKETEKRCCNCL
jgi:uncharacterized protein YpmB